MDNEEQTSDIALNAYSFVNEHDQRSSESKESLSETNLSNTLLTSKTTSDSSNQHLMIETPNHTNSY